MTLKTLMTALILGSALAACQTAGPTGQPGEPPTDQRRGGY
ncbi:MULTISPECIES: hypothetical protein [unclassified Roseibium]